jgi:FkbM family methyltransferase
MRAAAVIFSTISRKLFDGYAIQSFSQFGEDRVIECFFHGKESGVFVDVGCNHPIGYSNTWKLYLKGWRGIAIDANLELITEYKKIRPNDVAIHKVISNKKEAVEFYFSKTSHLISGIGEKHDGNWKRTKENSQVVRCQSSCLHDILQEQNVQTRFDLLSVDVEGSELDVLESLRLSIYTPKLIVVEMHDFDVSKPTSDPVYKLLLQHDYRLIGYLPPSGFFAWRGNNG